MALRPKRLVILERLTAQLETIVTSVAAVPMASRVSRGKEVLGDESAPPWLSIIQGPRPEIWLPADDSMTIEKGDWLLFIQGWADRDDSPAATDTAEWLLADVHACLAMISETSNQTGNPVFPDLYLLGRLVNEIRIGPGVVRGPDKQATTRTGFYLPVIVGAVLDYRRPFIDV